jgi:uncharacterized protein
LQRVHAEVTPRWDPDPARFCHLEVVPDLEPADGAALDPLDRHAQVEELHHVLGHAATLDNRRFGHELTARESRFRRFVVSDFLLPSYRDGLGLQTKGVVATDLVDEKTGAEGAIVIFKLENGLILTLYPRSELAKDAAVPTDTPQSGEFSLGQLVASRADADSILEQAAAAGAVVMPPHDRPWGIYSGYFRGPDGHLWEIIWNSGHRSDAD